MDARVDNRRPTTGATAPAQEDDSVTPEAILQLGLGFWASKTLLSAVELEKFLRVHGDSPGSK